MEIVYVIEDFSIKGGAERIIAEKANYLASEFQNHVTIISIYKDSRPISYPLVKGVDFLSLEIPFVPKNNSIFITTILRLFTIGRIVARFQKAINRLKPDIIFYTMSLGGILLPLCKTQAKRIYESHSARSFTPYHQLFYPMEKKADQIICLTQGDAKEYKYTKKISVIPNFINIPVQKVKDYGCKRAIAIGRLEHQKGFDRLISCWKEIAHQYPDWQLDIYGEGSLRNKLQNMIDSLELGEQVKLCGRSEHMMDLYPNYSLHLMSSHYEGQPMVMLEAQSYGLPAVTFDFQYGANDIIQNGYNGIIVEQDNETAFTAAILRMITEPNLREEYGKNAIKVAQRYSKEKISSQWSKLIYNFSYSPATSR